MKRKSLFTAFLVLMTLMVSCQNSEWNYPDYEYQSVYFAYQYPVRTIILGESKFDTELDNNHQFQIMATTAGVYENEEHVMVDFEVDASLVDGFLFNSASGDTVKPLPESHYNFVSESNQMTIPKGELAGGVKVQLTDAFFDDPEAIQTTYVVPVRMTSVANADTILSGTPNEVVDNPRRGVAADWDVLPKDFTFYAIKYINRLDGLYLRRGEDVITGQNDTALDTTVVREADFIVKDEVVELNTHSLTEIEFPVSITDGEGEDRTLTLLLEFDDSGSITISENDNATDFTATGSGTFIHKDESEESWGDESRNAIYLDYEIDHNDIHVETADSLVLRDRGIGMETFTPVLP